jgi:hypothetical protein
LPAAVAQHALVEALLERHREPVHRVLVPTLDDLGLGRDRLLRELGLEQLRVRLGLDGAGPRRGESGLAGDHGGQVPPRRLGRVLDVAVALEHEAQQVLLLTQLGPLRLDVAVDGALDELRGQVRLPGQSGADAAEEEADRRGDLLAGGLAAPKVVRVDLRLADVGDDLVDPRLRRPRLGHAVLLEVLQLRDVVSVRRRQVAGLLRLGLRLQVGRALPGDLSLVELALHLAPVGAGRQRREG